VFKKYSDRRKIYFTFQITILCIYSAVLYCDKIPEKNGLKIVSLSPAMTEILFALGAEDKLVGVTTFCDYPEEAKQLYKVGDFSHPSIERIIGLKPDLVIVNLPEQLRVKQTLEKLNINIFISSPKSLSDIYREIAMIGELIKKKSAADSLIGYMKANIDQSKPENKKRVYVELAPRPIVTIGSASFLNELIELAGAKNIFSDLNKEYPIVSQETVIKRDPELILLLHPGNISDRVGWKEIAAVKNKRIFKDLNQDYLLRPGPRLVEGFNTLKRALGD
jgi:iron complex transport system substrate-binding protein